MSGSTYEKICASLTAYNKYKRWLMDIESDILQLSIKIYFMYSEIEELKQDNNDDSQTKILHMKLDMHFAKRYIKNFEKSLEKLRKLTIHEEKILIELDAYKNWRLIREIGIDIESESEILPYSVH